ncbi:hypothetical protein C7999DRAFT_27073 [Corynascus novoguineensis]|uniref:Uncharacterized protein n=1 Tax=Corynascus novoguineensis TaxID=1126955 RepID=A0AAN7HJA9_9PEZI|nr:hypothetical protein C7999DRAFT_27073 [Corynascus novoguineensis]
MPNRELAAQIVAMCWDHDSLPQAGPGCLMPGFNGGYFYVPYDESREGLPLDLQDGINKLERWFKDPANGPIMRKMDKMLEKEVNKKCFWEFLDGGNASRIDFHGKIKMLARYRLMQTGVDVAPNDPRNPQFEFGIVNITEFGNVKMKWNNLDWNCTESQVVNLLENYSKPLFDYATVREGLLKDLLIIHQPQDAAEEAEILHKKLKSQQTIMDEPDWLYFFCNERDAATLLGERDWKTLRKQPNDIKLMKRESREKSKWPIIIRPSKLSHYNLCDQVFNLQRRQMEYCQEVEPALLEGPQDAGEQCFKRG